MQATRKGPDFIAIDGGEGGTGAAPLVFSDSVAYPFRIGFAKVFNIFYTAGFTPKFFYWVWETWLS